MAFPARFERAAFRLGENRTDLCTVPRHALQCRGTRLNTELLSDSFVLRHHVKSPDITSFSKVLLAGSNGVFDSLSEKGIVPERKIGVDYFDHPYFCKY